MNRTTRLLVLAAILLISALLAVASTMLQRYEITVEHGPAPEAQQNPYLAATHFLRKQGLNLAQTEHVSAKHLPSSEQHTLIWLAKRAQMTPRDAERLLQWSANGGHLILIAERTWNEKAGKSGDLLLDLLGIEMHLSKDLETSEPDPQDELLNRYPHLTQLYLENEPAPAYIGFSSKYHLHDGQDRAHAWANSASATHLLQLFYGEGLITVLSDPSIWLNHNIDQYDNAWLLWYLSQDSAVTLVNHSQHESFARLLLKHFPLSLLIGALLIAATLWRCGMRHGPVLPEPNPARRQLQEHLYASAEFTLRQQGQQHLLKALQHDIKRRARRLHSGFDNLAVAQQWQVLSSLSRLSSKDISQAMRPPLPKPLSASDFTRQVAHLQTLRNAL